MKEIEMRTNERAEAGFSLLEMLIAMTITLLMMTAASSLLTSSVGTRARENKRSDALADAQRAVTIMSREIANSGFGLTDNGIVTTDATASKIRIRANVNNTNLTISDQDEDVTYIYQAAPVASIVRFDKATGTTTVLANNISAFNIIYQDASSVVVAPALAERITIDVTVEVGAPAGQPPQRVRLMSDVALRNAPEVLQRY
ncbi:MAG TPA: prepilin-type N-terminal cleavage/methylation domain-containing protein [Pyrinomonadaceae bacterium]|jgi:prepilin-type N-terminal cleavage/methylation domain-containing protein|nr:prepilin-type N-terminal cleavage/methylation domain-containing protein [Pyrinomonadaceae bacterium]